MKLTNVTLLLAALLPNIANAAFPEGQWTASVYTDSTATLWNTVGICIVGTGESGTWYSTSQLPGSGNWYMKGNAIHLNGKYEYTNLFSESVELTRIHANLLTGYWQQWQNNTSLNQYFTTEWRFSSATCNARF